MKTIEFVDESKILIDGSIFVREKETTETKTEFKVGQWVITPAGILRRIKEFKKKDEEGVQIAFDDYGEIIQLTSFYHPTTPQEIETHLRKICDEKYIGKKVKGLLGSDGIIKSKGHYCFENDWLQYISKNGIGITVYEQGKFAEIISDKKKLPETKVEFEEFYVDWCKSDGKKTFIESINECED